MTRVSWSELKKQITNNALVFKLTTDDNSYCISVFDGTFHACSVIPITNPPSPDQLDFETNFKAGANLRIDQIDSDGANLSRIKAAPSGWSFQMRALDFTTANETTLVNNDSSNNALSDASITLYDGSGNVVSGAIPRLTAVKTVIDLEPAYDYYIVGGEIKALSTPESDIRCSIIGAPDVPYGLGGSRPFIQNVNFKFLSNNNNAINADGRAAKFLPYSATYHSNKLRFIFYHGAGIQCSFCVMIETFRL